MLLRRCLSRPCWPWWYNVVRLSQKQAPFLPMRVFCTYIIVWFFPSAGFNVCFLGQPSFVELNTVRTLLVQAYTGKGALVRKALGNKFMFFLILESTKNPLSFHPRITQMVKKRGMCRWIRLNEGPSSWLLFSLSQWDAISHCSLFSWPGLLLDKQDPPVSTGTGPPALSATSSSQDCSAGWQCASLLPLTYLAEGSYPLRQMDLCV